MSTFLTGKSLEEAIDNIIWEAKEVLLLVSPFIKLDDHFKKLFKQHTYNENLHIVIVFGKNEKKVSKSFSRDDFDFFKQFPKVSIIYASKLHGKYYGNEKKGVVTSANLYDYSFINENIEFGVYSEQSILDKFITTGNNIDNDAFNYCMDIAEENEVVFIKRPVYKPNKLIINLGKSYINKSEVLLDNTEQYYGTFKTPNKSQKKLIDFPEEIITGSSNTKRPSRTKEKPTAKTSGKTQNKGYCIRTGKEIPFNPERPMCYEAYQTWIMYGNRDYPEAYCHKTGKKSNGKTSMANPIL